MFGKKHLVCQRGDANLDRLHGGLHLTEESNMTEVAGQVGYGWVPGS